MLENYKNGFLSFKIIWFNFLTIAEISSVYEMQSINIIHV